MLSKTKNIVIILSQKCIDFVGIESNILDALEWVLNAFLGF
jgi:hypothetical protein